MWCKGMSAMGGSSPDIPWNLVTLNKMFNPIGLFQTCKVRRLQETVSGFLFSEVMAHLPLFPLNSALLTASSLWNHMPFWETHLNLPSDTMWDPPSPCFS